MELELKHLAHYLPYELQIFNKKSNDIETLKALNESGTLYTGSFFNNWDHIYNFKSILRPLSDLTKEIEVKGEKFIPVYFFNNINSDIDFELQIRGLSYDIKFLNSTYYGIVEKLFEWHFDVFGLIEKDLAIDINTLDK